MVARTMLNKATSSLRWRNFKVEVTLSVTTSFSESSVFKIFSGHTNYSLFFFVVFFCHLNLPDWPMFPSIYLVHTEKGYVNCVVIVFNCCWFFFSKYSGISDSRTVEFSNPPITPPRFPPLSGTIILSPISQTNCPFPRDFCFVICIYLCTVY